jgi:hypothetical protein
MFTIQTVKVNLCSGINEPGREAKISSISIVVVGARGSVVVKALSYKPEGCGFETNTSGHTRPWGLLSL